MWLSCSIEADPDPGQDDHPGCKMLVRTTMIILITLGPG